MVQTTSDRSAEAVFVSLEARIEAISRRNLARQEIGTHVSAHNWPMALQVAGDAGIRLFDDPELSPKISQYLQSLGDQLKALQQDTLAEISQAQRAHERAQAEARTLLNAQAVTQGLLRADLAGRELNLPELAEHLHSLQSTERETLSSEARSWLDALLADYEWLRVAFGDPVTWQKLLQVRDHLASGRPLASDLRTHVRGWASRTPASRLLPLWLGQDAANLPKPANVPDLPARDLPRRLANLAKLLESADVDALFEQIKEIQAHLDHEGTPDSLHLLAAESLAAWSFRVAQWKAFQNEVKHADDLLERLNSGGSSAPRVDLQELRARLIRRAEVTVTEVLVMKESSGSVRTLAQYWLDVLEKLLTVGYLGTHNTALRSEEGRSNVARELRRYSDWIEKRVRSGQQFFQRYAQLALASPTHTQPGAHTEARSAGQTTLPNIASRTPPKQADPPSSDVNPVSPAPPIGVPPALEAKPVTKDSPKTPGGLMDTQAREGSGAGPTSATPPTRHTSESLGPTISSADQTIVSNKKPGREPERPAPSPGAVGAGNGRSLRLEVDQDELIADGIAKTRIHVRVFRSSGPEFDTPATTVMLRLVSDTLTDVGRLSRSSLPSLEPARSVQDYGRPEQLVFYYHSGRTAGTVTLHAEIGDSSLSPSALTLRLLPPSAPPSPSGQPEEIRKAYPQSSSAEPGGEGDAAPRSQESERPSDRSGQSGGPSSGDSSTYPRTDSYRQVPPH